MKVQHTIFAKALLQNFIVYNILHSYQNTLHTKSNFSKSINESNNEFPMIKFIIDRMGTVITQPDETIINEGEKSIDLFFI